MIFIQNYRCILFCTIISLLTHTTYPMNKNLFSAVNAGDITLINALLDSKSDINQKNSNGESPLMVATEKNLPEIAQLLIDRKADVDDTNPLYGFTPLLLASLRGISPMVELLLTQKANPTIADQDNLTPLTIALCAHNRPGDTRIIQMLVHASANPQLQDTAKKKALQLTCSNKEKRKALIEAQEDVRRADALPLILSINLKPFLPESLIQLIDEYAALPYKN